MPARLYVNKDTLARRHVLSQQLYRLRKKYKMLTSNGSEIRASVIYIQIREKESEYNYLGGKPRHKGNVLCMIE